MNCILAVITLKSIRLFHDLVYDLPCPHAINSNELSRYTDEQQRTIRLIAFNTINFSYRLLKQIQGSLSLSLLKQSSNIDVRRGALRVRQLTGPRQTSCL